MFAYAAILLAGLSAPHVAAVQPSDLAFGREQVEKFIHDRPDAGAVINHHPVLKEQLALLFADDGQGDDGQVQRVHWDNQEPSTGLGATHLIADGDDPAAVQVSSQLGLSAIDQCTMLLFELYLTRTDGRVKVLGWMVYRDQIDRDDYAISMAESEFKALMDTQDFLLEHPIRGANAEDDEGYEYVTQLTDDFSDYLRFEDSDKKHSSLELYREAFDQIVSHRPAPKSNPETFETWKSYGIALTTDEQPSVFTRHLKMDSPETADSNPSDLNPTRMVNRHVWPDALDLTVTVAYFAFIVLLLVVGYVSMGLHIRDYYRSLRRALVVLGHYSRKLPAWVMRDRPRCIQALDLSLPCTTSEVLTAYRKKVKLLHPDRGGDPREFLRLQEHFEQAMALAGD